MFKKLELISQKLKQGRTDVWECEMLCKLVNNDLADPYTIDYLNDKFVNPYQSSRRLISKLYQEAQRTI